MEMKTYTVHSAASVPALDADWEAPCWAAAETAAVDFFYPRSSDHHPDVRVRLLRASTGLHGIFHVRDRYVRSLSTAYMQAVYQDACVEFFVKPAADKGYINFEMNAGGALLCTYITDPTRTPGGFAAFSSIPLEDARQVRIRSTLPPQVDPEIEGPLTWALEFFIPFALLEKYAGPLDSSPGQVWRANFYKCAENNSHPHWASWNPLPALNFHQPDGFGRLVFA